MYATFHRGFCLAIGFGIVAGCATTDTAPTDSESVANVFVSAYPAVRWASISDKLDPHFDLTTADARSLAAVSTQSQINQTLSTLAAGLAIGLPGATHDSTTVLNADGTSTSTGTRKIIAGSVPGAAGPVSPPITDTSLIPDLSKGAPAQGVDGYTQLMGATSLLQLSKILESQISQAIVPEGYRAYLVTFQINLQPLQRNRGYDAYVNLTLMPASWQKALATSTEVGEKADALSPVIMYPLVVTDAMETGNVAKSVEIIRQASLALSGIVNNIGIGGNVQKGSDAFDALLGSDRNSLITVGRVGDHSLRVRIGAQLQGTTRFALVPRSYNVSVVIFTKADVSSERRFIDRLAVITKASFVSMDGTLIPSSRDTAPGLLNLKKNLDDALQIFGYQVADACRQDNESSLDLLRAMNRGDYGYLNRCLKADSSIPLQRDAFSDWHRIGDCKDFVAKDQQFEMTLGRILTPDENRADISCLGPTEEARIRRVVAEIMTLQSDSRYSKLTVQLDSFDNVVSFKPDTRQIALLADSKAASKVVLRGGTHLDAKKLNASLLFKEGAEERLLPATSVEVGDDGSSVALTFPSLSANHLTIKEQGPKPGETVEAAPTGLKVALTLYREESRRDTQVIWDTTYDTRFVMAEEEKSSNPLSSPTSVLVVDANGNAVMSLLSPPWPASNGALGIRIVGADVRSIEPLGGYDAKRSAYAIPASAAVRLTLGNVSPSRPVVIKTLAGPKEVGSITLPVEVARLVVR